MKKYFFSALLLIAVAFTGCKKDDAVPDRDKFIGTWTGTMTISEKTNGQTISSETSVASEKIDSGTDDNQVLFNKNTDAEIRATVSGSALTIPKQTKVANISGQTISAEYSGSGTLSSNKVLTLEYTLDFKDGYSIYVTETLNKN